MKFNYVKFRNFLSYGDKIQTIPLSESGVTLVLGQNKRNGGSNGAGKSAAIVDSITYALFGQTTKRLKSDQVINNKKRKDCYVEICFNIGPNKYIIKRYRNHGEFGNSIILSKDGRELESEKLRDAQKQIDDIIKIGYKSFVMSIVLSQEKVSNFAESDETERRKIIENLLMYDFISKYHRSNKEILRKIKGEFNSVEIRFNDKKESISTLTSNLIDYIDKMEEEEEKKAKRVEEINRKLETYKNLDLGTEIRNREKLKSKIAEKELVINKIENAEEEIVEEKGTLKRKTVELKKKNDEIKEVEDNPEECPVCGNEIKEGILKDYYDGRINEKKSIEKEIDGKEEKIGLLDNRLANLKKDVTTITKRITRLREKIHNDLTDKEIANIQSEIPALKSELKILGKEIDVEEDDYVKKMQSQIDKAKSESQKLKKKIRRLERDQKHHTFWHNALSNSDSSMKSFCINYILQSLNKYINYYLKFFNLDIEYTLNNDLQDIIMKDGIEHSFSQLSGGEKRAVEVSLIFALYEIVRLKMPDNINVIVLDELLSQYFDEVRVESAIEILQELEYRGLCIFVIDHKSSLQQNLDCQIMTIVKDKQGFSTIEPAAS